MSLHIVVCVKQTPSPAEMHLDEETGALVREGVTLVLSSLDRRALLEGLRLRDETAGTLTVLTMGPPQARDALVECLALGADQAVHLSDRAFAGADTLATARALSAALKKLAPDLILCGKFSIDAETAQVPSEIAEMLDLPQVTSVRKIRPAEGSQVFWVERETDEGYEHYHVSLPALISVTEFITTPRRPSPEEMEAAQGKPIETWAASDLGVDPEAIGAAGSPTRVGKLQSAALERKGTVISGDDPEKAASQLLDYLVTNGLFEPRLARQAARPRRLLPASLDPERAVWVVAELVDGQPRPVTYELLGEAQILADGLGGEVAAVLLGDPDAAEHVSALGAYGADTVYIATDEDLASYDTYPYTRLLAQAIQDFKPHVVMLPSTTNGRDLAPRVAARLQIGLTGDCIGVELTEEGDIAQLKPAFGGNIVSPIFSRTYPVMATVRPGMLEACQPDWSVQPHVVTLPLVREGVTRVRKLEAIVQPDLGATKLDGADVVVTVGLGIGGPENVPTVKELADALGGALAASLRFASNGWLPPQLQVGLTGKAVAPRFYIAVGVSGQPNHLVGSKRAEHIIAINNDPEAPIFQSANFGIVGDWAQIVPTLTRAVREARERTSV